MFNRIASKALHLKYLSLGMSFKCAVIALAINVLKQKNYFTKL